MLILIIIILFITIFLIIMLVNLLVNFVKLQKSFISFVEWNQKIYGLAINQKLNIFEMSINSEEETVLYENYLNNIRKLENNWLKYQHNQNQLFLELFERKIIIHKKNKANLNSVNHDCKNFYLNFLKIYQSLINKTKYFENKRNIVSEFYQKLNATKQKVDLLLTKNLNIQFNFSNLIEEINNIEHKINQFQQNISTKITDELINNICLITALFNDINQRINIMESIYYGVNVICPLHVKTFADELISCGKLYNLDLIKKDIYKYITAKLESFCLYLWHMAPKNLLDENKFLLIIINYLFLLNTKIKLHIILWSLVVNIETSMEKVISTLMDTKYIIKHDLSKNGIISFFNSQFSQDLNKICQKNHNFCKNYDINIFGLNTKTSFKVQYKSYSDLLSTFFTSCKFLTLFDYFCKIKFVISLNIFDKSNMVTLNYLLKNLLTDTIEQQSLSDRPKSFIKQKNPNYSCLFILTENKIDTKNEENEIKNIFISENNFVKLLLLTHQQ